MSDLFLTPEELVELTGYKQPSKQIAALRRQCVRVFVTKTGKPRVVRSALENKREPERTKPNFEPMPRLGRKKDT